MHHLAQLGSSITFLAIVQSLLVCPPFTLISSLQLDCILWRPHCATKLECQRSGRNMEDDHAVTNEDQRTSGDHSIDCIAQTVDSSAARHQN